MKEFKVALLGCGKMVSALTLGWKDHVPFHHYTFTPSKTRAKDLAQKLEGTFVETLEQLPPCDIYLLGCKPQNVQELATDLKDKISKDAIIISVLAGVETKRLQELFGPSKVLRVMPNTPVLVGAGVNALYFSESFSSDEKAFFQKSFESFSMAKVFDQEEMIDIITGVSGSGPAYIFEFARILSEKLVSMGLERETALDMVIETFYGASKLMKESSESPLELRNNVTSKKGVTHEALEVFKENQFESIVSKAIDAAFKRSVELSKS